ncbi:hypothetical protein QGP82_24890 [Leptothoe sp. LEGE 181152]|nr:hypothetical protein [Leptothoe sp. LEGE 181152]
MSGASNRISNTDLSSLPYKGLAHYSETDAPFFFGRASEWEVVADNLMATRLTLLYGASGVGKSSLLRAGVAYHLQQDARKNLVEFGAPEFAVVVFNAWQDNPLEALTQHIEKEIKSLLNGKTFEALSPSLRFNQMLESWAERLNENEGGGELFIILDQFEEYFLYHPNEKGKGTFAEEFPRAINRPDLSVNFLISIREDALAKLDRFKVSIPNIFSNYLRIDHLDAKSAYDAISKPIEVYNRQSPDKTTVTLEDSLVKVVVDQVSQFFGGSDGRGISKESRVELEKQIEAPYLQLVMEYLWKKEIENKRSNSLRLQTLFDMGGAEKIVSDHLSRQMDLLRKEEGEASLVVIARIFQYLVTPSGSKIAYPLKDLIGITEWPETRLRRLLEKLTSGKQRLLRTTSKSSDAYSERYEIFHDVLAQPILDWRKQYLLDEEKYRRNLAIKEGLPAQSIRQIKSMQDEKAALLVRQAYCFYKRERNKVLYQIDEALREILSISYFSNILRSHEKGVFGFAALAFNPKNPQMLASADYNGIIRLWDLHRSPTVHPPQILQNQQHDVHTLAFSPDGKILAASGADCTIHLWSNIDQSNLSSRILGHHDQNITSVAFNWDGTILASGSDDGKIKLWNLDNQSEDESVAVLRGHQAAVKAVAFSPDRQSGYLLASGSKDKLVNLWDIRDNTCLKVLIRHADVVRSVAFSPDGQWLASGGEDKNIVLWDLRDLKQVEELETLLAHKDSVHSVAFSQDGQWLASGSEDQTICLWELAAVNQKVSRLKERLKGHSYGVSAVAFSPDNQLLASSSWDKTIRLWHLYPSKEISRIIGKHTDNIVSVAVSPDGHWLASGSWDKTVRLYDLSNPNVQPRVIGEHDDKVFVVAFDQTSQMLASGSKDQTIKLWRDFQNPVQQPEILRGHLDVVSSVAFSSDGRWLASGSWSKDGTVRLWDLLNSDATGQTIDTILWKHEEMETHASESVTSVAFSQDGQMLASASYDKTIKLLDLRKTDGLSWDSLYEQPNVAPIVLKGHSARVWSIAFSPNSQTLASGSDDRTIRLWDLSQTEVHPTLLKELEEHNFWVSSVVFSPDGKRLVSGSYDKTIRMWNLRHLDEDPIVLRGHEQSVTSVAFYPDSKTLISGSYDNTVRHWIIDTDQLADMVCEKVQRNLTQKEWQWFMGPDIPYEQTCSNLPPGEGTLAERVRVQEVSELEREFRVKLAQLFSGQKYVLQVIAERDADQKDTAEEDISTPLNKPKGDEGTYYRLETLRLLGFLKMTDPGQGPGSIRYGLSSKYREYLNKIKEH